MCIVVYGGWLLTFAGCVGVGLVGSVVYWIAVGGGLEFGCCDF